MYSNYSRKRAEAKKKTRSHIKGCLIGVAIGDALGVPFEHVHPGQTISHNGKELPGIDGFYSSDIGPAGTWSDDTALTLATCQGFIEHMTEGAALEAACYRAFAYSSLPRPGHTVPTAIKNRRPDPTSWSNGALMRLAPAGILAWHLDYEARLALELVVRVARLTHSRAAAVLPAVEYALSILSILRDEKTVPDFLPLFREHADLLQEYDLDPETYAQERGQELDAIHPSNAIWMWRHLVERLFLLSPGDPWDKLPSFEEGIFRAVNESFDRDTAGAVAGGLLGAFWSLDGIPERLRTGVRKANYILQTADDLETASDNNIRAHIDRDFTRKQVEPKQQPVTRQESRQTEDEDRPFPEYFNQNEVRICGFFNAIVRNAALKEKYPGGLRAFLVQHAACYNKDLSIACAMSPMDIDKTFQDLEKAGLESKKDFCLIDAGNLMFEDRLDIRVDWLEYAGKEENYPYIRLKNIKL